MRVLRSELVGGEGLIYLATRVSRKVGGPEDIAEELKDENRVKRLIRNVIMAGHFSVLEHSLIRVWVETEWSDITRLLFQHKYVEASQSEGGSILVSMNPRAALEMLDSEARPLAEAALRETPVIAEAAGLVSDRPVDLSVKMRKVSEDPLVYSFVCSPHEDPRHGFYAFWTEMSRVASHQFVRHRRLSFTQRSGRYTSPDGFIFPRTVGSEALELMREQAKQSYEVYMRLLEMGLRKEDARYILPAALKTALFVSGRQSDWHHFLKLRTDIHAQDEIRRFATVVAEVIGW